MKHVTRFKVFLTIACLLFFVQMVAAEQIIDFEGISCNDSPLLCSDRFSVSLKDTSTSALVPNVGPDEMLCSCRNRLQSDASGCGSDPAACVCKKSTSELIASTFLDSLSGTEIVVDCSQSNALDGGGCCCWISDPTGAHNYGHVLDLGVVVANPSLSFDIRPGCGDCGCITTGYYYYSEDGSTWTQFWSEGNLNGWQTYTRSADIIGNVRYLRANTDGCSVDYAAVRVSQNLPVLKIVDAKMISPNELGIGITVNFPVGTPTDVSKKVRFTANINGKDVDVELFITPKIDGSTTSIGLDPNYKVSARTPLKINLKDQIVPRFTENVVFTLYGETYYEGGPHSQLTPESQKDIEILLPVLLIHGYRLEHTVIGKMAFVQLTRVAYDPMITELEENGYTEDRFSGYRTLYAPRDIEYNALRETPASITLKANGWVETAKKNSYADKVNLIGHCLGGLIVRNYAGDPVAKENGISKVNKVIMIASPHGGETFFFEQAFAVSRRDAEKLVQVPGSKQNNLLLWAVPTYDSLRDWSGEIIENPLGFRNNYHPVYNPDVQYLNIFADDLETRYKLTVLPADNNWYAIGGILGNSVDKGDDSVLAMSADSPVFANKRIVSATDYGHGFLCKNPWVIDYTVGFIK